MRTGFVHILYSKAALIINGVFSPFIVNIIYDFIHNIT